MSVRKPKSIAQIKLAIIKKKQLEAKALKIVIQLLEPIIEPQWLLQNLQHINKSHMEDVIEERAIEKLCGYVLCKNPITVIITQKFHISIKKNKVYDVSKRKNFCSSHCYASCNYLLEQMLTSPLWFRDKEKIPEFHLLSSKKDMLGDEVLIKDSVIPKENDNENIESIEKIKKENILDTVTTVCNQLSENDDEVFNIVSNECTVMENTSSNNSVSECIRTEDSEVHSNKNNINLENHQNEMTNEKAPEFFTNNKCDNENFNEKTEISQKCYEIIVNTSNVQVVEKECKDDMKVNEVVTKSENILENKKEYPIKNLKDKCENLQQMNDNNVKKNASTKNIKKKKISNNSEQLSNKFYTLTMPFEKNVKEWITEATLSFLQGTADTRFDLMKNFTEQEKYLQLCTKLNKLELIDKQENRTDLSNNKLKPLPDFSTLQEEADKMNLKVHAFYNGSMAADPSEKVVKNKEPSESSYLLPLVDSVAPKALRRKIFLNKLHKILPDLLNVLAGNTRCYSEYILEYIYDSSQYTSIKVLVNTFSLSATNIVFKTAEWTLVGLIIIKMLSIINPQLKALLAKKQVLMRMSMILMSYKLDSYYLDRFIIELTNNSEIFKIK